MTGAAAVRIADVAMQHDASDPADDHTIGIDTDQRITDHDVRDVVAETMRILREEVQRSSVAAVARRTGLPRTSVASILTGTARRGTVALARAALDRLAPPPPPKGAA